MPGFPRELARGVEEAREHELAVAVQRADVDLVPFAEDRGVALRPGQDVGHPAVTCPIPATSKPKHLADNVRAGFGRLPDEAMRRKMVKSLGL